MSLASEILSEMKKSESNDDKEILDCLSETCSGKVDITKKQIGESVSCNSNECKETYEVGESKGKRMINASRSK